MLSSSSSCSSINRNQLNQSSSKQLFSFPKQSRFICKTEVVTSNAKYVDLPGIAQIITKKGISFTKSRKKLMFENQKQQVSLPPPNIYHTEEIKSTPTGFYIGRKLKNITKKNPENSPGPNSYNNIHKKSGSSLSASFSKQAKKLKYPISNRKGNDAPGPYYMETKKVNDMLSKFKKSREVKISLLSKRNEKIQSKIKKHEQEILQRAKKNSKSEKNKKNSHNLAIYNSRKNVVFGKSEKKTCFDIPKKQKKPGPASYQKFSEFAEIEKPLKNKNRSLPLFVALNKRSIHNNSGYQPQSKKKNIKTER